MAMSALEGVVAEGWYGEERTRIVRLCRQITGRADIAEDLAQETLAEAWRLRDRLTEPVGCDRWLSAIARNVCRRWMRAQGREQLRRVATTIDAPNPADGWELDVELEREELSLLLDRALALLPPDTRGSLVARYVEELPHAEIAERNGISQGAVAMRLLRGRLALRRLLATELRDEAESYGLVRGTTPWQETRIWCPVCGDRRLSGRTMAESGELRLRCFGCFPTGQDHQVLNVAHTKSADLLCGVTGWKASLSRVMSSFDAYFSRAVAEQSAPCLRCGVVTSLRRGLATGNPSGNLEVIGSQGVHVRCERCGETADMHLLGLALYGSVGRQFWQKHPRLHMLPTRTIEAQGSAAIVARFESVTNHAVLDVILAQDTYQVLRIHEPPSP